MNSPDKPMAIISPSRDKVSSLTLVHGTSYLDVHMEDGIATLEFHFYLFDPPPQDCVAEVLDLLRCWEKPLWEPARQFVLAFFGPDLHEPPLSRLRTDIHQSNVWSCKFRRSMPISPKVLNRWDSCSIQLQFEFLKFDHFSIFVNPRTRRLDLTSVKEELELIDKSLNLASVKLGHLIGAMLMESDTKVAFGKTTAPTNPEDPDDCYATKGVVVD